MKILCVCQRGNKRSVFTRFALSWKHDALAVGVEANSAETLKMLSEWADVILLAMPKYKKYIPTKCQKKVDDRFTIGEDIYPISITGSLVAIVKAKLRGLKYI